MPRSRHRPAPHVVTVVALDGVSPFDLAIPCEVFARARLADGTAPYTVRVCGPRRTIRAGAFSIRVGHGLEALAHADTIVVPGIEDPSAPVPPAVRRSLGDAAARGARLASICTGAFVLAAAGLLDGRRATTHWMAAAELARRHPSVTVEPDVLYVDEGRVLTSAGAAAGLDLCLHMVRGDHGAEVAAEGARLAVMPLERAGGHAQRIVRPATPDHESLEPLLRWLDAHHADALTVARIAREAAMSPRSLSRRFRAEVGTTPARWLAHARVRRAQRLLETSGRTIERIAVDVGFGSAATFRDRFQRVVGTSPQAYRRRFREVAAR